jgi:prepilin-type N-terminal cleavage/methylation domain-containing protein/prepilin-type processing-associated H-X9-DG protein
MRTKIEFRVQLTSGFSLLELLIVIAIVGMLATLATPVLGKARERAESAKCLANLRNIGVAMLSYVAENDNRFPTIEPNPSNPAYDASEQVGTLLEVLGDYGVTETSLRCPTDLRTFNYFKINGSSYEWIPVVDDELANNPAIYGRRGVRYRPTHRIPVARDFAVVHGGRPNLLFADGRVRAM